MTVNMKREPANSARTTRPDPSDMHLPELEGGNVRVIAFGGGRIIMATRPWSLVDLGVPHICWTVTVPGQSHKYAFYGRVVYTPGGVEVGYRQGHAGHSRDQHQCEIIAKGWLDVNYYHDTINDYVCKLLNSGAVINYGINFTDTSPTVTMEGLTSSMMSRLTSRVEDGSCERLYMENLELLGVEVRSSNDLRYQAHDTTRHRFSTTDMAIISSPAILEWSALLAGTTLTNHQLI